MRYENGGVARNIAENMALLGSLPFLISVVGDDVAGMSVNFVKHFVWQERLRCECLSISKFCYQLLRVYFGSL